MNKHRTEDELRNELLKFMTRTSFSANYIGNQVGCHPQTITNWVNGTKSMRVDTLESIHVFMEKVNETTEP